MESSNFCSTFPNEDRRDIKIKLITESFFYKTHSKHYRTLSQSWLLNIQLILQSINKKVNYQRKNHKFSSRKSQKIPSRPKKERMSPDTYIKRTSVRYWRHITNVTKGFPFKRLYRKKNMSSHLNQKTNKFHCHKITQIRAIVFKFRFYVPSQYFVQYWEKKIT